MTTGISTKADEVFIDLSEGTSLKLDLNGRKLTQFWLSVQQTCPTLSLNIKCAGEPTTQHKFILS
jgi:hypothetical protein